MKQDLGKSSEYYFASKCMQEGLGIAFPFSERLPYDFIIDNGASLYRVQVKSVHNMSPSKKAYRRELSKNNGSGYTSLDTDFIVLVVHPAKTFYIFPIEDLKVKEVTVHPHESTCKYEYYKNNWDLLRNKVREFL